MSESTSLIDPPAADAPPVEGAPQQGATTPPPEGANSPADQKPGEDGDKKPDAPVVPESYDFAAPEGVTVDDAQIDGFKSLAKELGLTQEQFAKVAEYGVSANVKAAAVVAEAFQNTQREWLAAAAADPEIGVVDGKLSPDVQKDVSRALTAYGNPDLLNALAVTGAGNNPAVIKFVRAIGKAMGAAESLDFGKPAQPASADRSFNGTARRLYPNMPTAGA